MEKFVRNCVCGTVIEYGSYNAWWSANKRKAKCSVCAAKERRANPSSEIKRLKTIQERGTFRGENNPFFGMKHAESSKLKMSQTDRAYTRTPDFRQKISRATAGTRNGMHGKSYYEIWLDKFGEQVAIQKLNDLTHRLSIALSGSNNPMYGRPSPSGSGNGWSGWFEGWYFRSLRELAYLLKEILPHGKSWKSADNASFRIPYKDYSGHDRTYRADFVVDGDTLVEIKPAKLQASVANKLKFEAARRWCAEHGLKFKVVEPTRLEDAEIAKLWADGRIRFTDRYEQKFIQWHTEKQNLS